MYAYTWLPGNGLFWNPFGYGFYSASHLYGGGFVYGGGYGGFRGGTPIPVVSDITRGLGYVGGASHAGMASVGHVAGGFGGGFHGGGVRR